MKVVLPLAAVAGVVGAALLPAPLSVRGLLLVVLLGAVYATYQERVAAGAAMVGATLVAACFTTPSGSVAALVGAGLLGASVWMLLTLLLRTAPADRMAALAAALAAAAAVPLVGVLLRLPAMEVLLRGRSASTTLAWLLAGVALLVLVPLAWEGWAGARNGNKGDPP